MDTSFRVIVAMNVRAARKAPAKARRQRRKAQISDRLKRDLAAKYGCQRGETVPAKCNYCETVVSIRWSVHTAGAVGFVSFPGLQVDHVIPESRGGSTAIENLVLACRPCNLDKGNRTPDEWRLAR